MRTRVRKFAHVLERLGLAMAGAASGLFVAALVGTSVALFTSQAFLLFMMLGGAIGFYLGIDTPPLPFHASNGQPSDGHWVGKIDTPELLSAVGTFLAAFSAFASRRRDRAASRSAHRLDLDDHGRMGRGRDHADRRRRDRAPAPVRSAASLFRSDGIGTGLSFDAFLYANRYPFA